MRQKGFTIIEMIIIIVVLGILLPVIFLPLINASKGVATPAAAAGLSTVARKVMDEELARVDLQVWPPTGTAPGATTPFYCAGCAAPAAPASVTLNGNTYSSVITEKFCDNPVAGTGLNPLTPAACTNADTVLTQNHYLVIQVATTGSSGGSVTFQTIKTHDY